MMNRMHRVTTLASSAMLVMALFSGSARADHPVSRLYEAVLDGDLPKVQALVAAGADVPFVIEGHPLLGLAAGLDQKDANDEAKKHDQLAIVELLLTAKADPDARGKAGKTSLMRTAELGRFDMVKALLAAKADVGSRDNQGCSALHSAAANGHHEIITVLLEAKAAVSPICEKGTPLIEAARNGHLQAVKALLAAKAPTEARDKNGNTALFVAAFKGHKDVVEALIAAKANVNAQNNEGSSPISVAPFNEDRRDIVDLLIQAKADVNLADNGGETPLYWAAIRGHKNAVMALIAANAKLEAKDKHGYTPLLGAVIMGHKEIVESLLAAGADLNVKDKEGLSALLIGASSIERGHKEILGMLLKAGAKWPKLPAERFRVAVALDDVDKVNALIASKWDVNAGIGTKEEINQNKTDLPTPLILASAHGAIKIGKALLAANANVNAAPKQGITALAAAVMSDSSEMLQLLLSAGANPHVQMDLDDDLKSATLLHLAATKGDNEAIAKMLIAAKVDVNATARMDKLDGAVLMWAARLGRKNIVISLLEANADVNAKSKGFTALHAASQLTSVNAKEIVAALIAAKADLNAKDEDGNTPLALALKSNKEVAELIKQAGAKE